MSPGAKACRLGGKRKAPFSQVLTTVVVSTYVSARRRNLRRSGWSDGPASRSHLAMRLDELPRVLPFTARSHAAQYRTKAFLALRTLSRENANQQPMWANAAVRETLLEGSAADERVEAVREHALGALANLAAHTASQPSMWRDARVRSNFVSGAAGGEPEGVRQRAVNGLKNLTCARENRQPMWDNDGVRAVLVAGAQPDEHSEMRDRALGALRNLALHYGNQRVMWADERLRIALEAGAQPHAGRRALLWRRVHASDG